MLPLPPQGLGVMVMLSYAGRLPPTPCVRMLRWTPKGSCGRKAMTGGSRRLYSSADQSHAKSHLGVADPVASEDAPRFEPLPASEADVRCIEERQVDHRVTCIGISRRCKHGFPQAFVYHPSLVRPFLCAHTNGSGAAAPISRAAVASQRTLNSGLFRLSCPLLVKAIDEFEANGGIEELNSKMSRSESMQREFRRINSRHAAMRRSLATPEQLEPYVQKLGAAQVEQIMASGIAGVSPDKADDLKCLHAHVADYLCTGDNKIGEELLETLDKKGSQVTGVDECWQQCDPTQERTVIFAGGKNKLKLRRRRTRRMEQKRKLYE